MRTVRHLGVGVLLILVAAAGTPAQAHARLRSATPADGSTLQAAPASLVLEFSEAARLTALWIQKQGGDKKKLAPPQESQSRITVTLPQLAPGDYLVSWRVQGADGHVVPGQLHFTLRP
jgi:methionine-rich copper-binding protein CopC